MSEIDDYINSELGLKPESNLEYKDEYKEYNPDDIEEEKPPQKHVTFDPNVSVKTFDDDNYPQKYEKEPVVIVKNSFEIMCESIVSILKDILSLNWSADIFTKESRMTGLLYFTVLSLIIFLILTGNEFKGNTIVNI